MASCDEEARLELHRLGTLYTGLARHNNLYSECAALHYETDHAIACPSDLRVQKNSERNEHHPKGDHDYLQAAEQLVLKRFRLGHG